MWTRKELKDNAKALLKQNYGTSVLISFFYMLMAAVAVIIAYIPLIPMYIEALKQNIQKVNSADGTVTYASEVQLEITPMMIISILLAFVLVLLFSMFVLYPMLVGLYAWALKNRTGKATFSDMIDGFKNNYFQKVLTMFMVELFVFLWSLLFVIPGIIKAYQYRMVPFIIAENPEMSWREALAKSKEMMEGNKWKSFVLDFSFIGWILLSVYCTCYILLLLFVAPYIILTETELYAKLSGKGKPEVLDAQGKDFVDVEYEEVDSSQQAAEDVSDTQDNE